MAASSSSICLFAPAWVTTISRFLFIFIFKVMGRKAKMERVLENKIFDLGKILGGNWGFTGFWTLF